ncbi:MAG: type II secretion system F family protein, partial [Pseudonocardiaceae bacterium]
MTGQVLAMLVVATALVVAPGSAGPRSRLRQARGTCPAQRRERAPARWLGAHVDTGSESLALAGAWELLAACLRAGMPVPVAVRAVAEGLDAPAGPALRRTAELLSLGADPMQAWQPALECAVTARLAKAARRSGRSGTAIAELAIRLAAAVRADARERSEARAQRAGVLIAAP